MWNENNPTKYNENILYAFFAFCFIFGFSFEEFILVNDFDPFGTFA